MTVQMKPSGVTTIQLTHSEARQFSAGSGIRAVRDAVTALLKPPSEIPGFDAFVATKVRLRPQVAMRQGFTPSDQADRVFQYSLGCHAWEQFYIEDRGAIEQYRYYLITAGADHYDFDLSRLEELLYAEALRVRSELAQYDRDQVKP